MCNRFFFPHYFLVTQTPDIYARWPINFKLLYRLVMMYGKLQTVLTLPATVLLAKTNPAMFL